MQSSSLWKGPHQETALTTAPPGWAGTTPGLWEDQEDGSLLAVRAESIHGQLEPHGTKSPSKPKVRADPAFNSAGYINQTRCSEQWLTRVSQFPPTMSATLAGGDSICFHHMLFRVASGSFIFQAPSPSERYPTAMRVMIWRPGKRVRSSVFRSYLATPGLRAAPPLPNPSGSVLALSSEHDVFPYCCSVKQKEPAIPIYNINKEMS